MTNCLPLWSNDETKEAAKDGLRRLAEQMSRDLPVDWEKVFARNTPEASGTARKAPSGPL